MNLTKIALVTSMLLCLLNGAWSQTDIGAGTRSIALGETGLGFQDINAVYTNPSGLHSLAALSLHACVSSPFSVNALSQAQLAAGSRLFDADYIFGTVFSKGNSDFRRTRVSAGYGRKVADNLFMAVEFETLMQFIRGYGHHFAIGYGISFQHIPFSQLIIGAQIRNPIPIAKEGSLIPKSTIAVGLSYLPSKLVTINAEVFKDTQFKLRSKFGIEYIAHPVFTVRFGISINPAQFHFGFAWSVRPQIKVDFAASYHTLLGVTPSIGLAYSRI